MHVPAKSFEYALAQAITIARGLGRMVGRAVTFDRHQVSAWVLRVHDRQIEEVSSHPDLRVHVVSV